MRLSTASGLAMRRQFSAIRTPSQPRLEFDRLGVLDHRNTTSRRVLSYTSAHDARLHAYELPHRSIPPLSPPFAPSFASDAGASICAVPVRRETIRAQPVATTTLPRHPMKPSARLPPLRRPHPCSTDDVLQAVSVLCTCRRVATKQVPTALRDPILALNDPSLRHLRTGDQDDLIWLCGLF